MAGIASGHLHGSFLRYSWHQIKFLCFWVSFRCWNAFDRKSSLVTAWDLQASAGEQLL